MLEIKKGLLYILHTSCYADVTQLVESLPSKQVVAGSNPVVRSIKKPDRKSGFFMGLYDDGENHKAKPCPVRA